MKSPSSNAVARPKPSRWSTNGLTLAAHFGDGELRAGDVAASLVGAVVKDPVQDRVAWEEYLEAVAENAGAGPTCTRPAGS